jgi:hypothetical protein
MKEDRMTANSAHRDRACNAGEDGLDIRSIDVGHATGAEAEAGAGWQQPQLLPAAAPSTGRSAKPNDRLRHAGLVGIAQAREALAEAARRAKARSESRAA